MSTAAIRQKLHNDLEVAEDKKVKAIYALCEDEIEKVQFEYSEEFKDELDRRYNYYKSGGKMVSPEEVNKHINQILQKAKRK